MKKKSLLFIILVVTFFVVIAQPGAIGVRLGLGIGVSYQHQIGDKNMIQVDVDLPTYGLHGIQGTATYNWIIPLKSWNIANCNFIAGVGVGVGYQWWAGGGDVILFPWDRSLKNLERGTFLGAAGIIGFEWNFKFPLQLAIEYRPLVGPFLYQRYENTSQLPVKNEIGVDFYYRGLWESAVAISVRYKFGRK